MASCECKVWFSPTKKRRNSSNDVISSRAQKRSKITHTERDLGIFKNVRFSEEELSSIRVYDSHLHSQPHHRRPSQHNPGAMSIPRARSEVPPPLPPPRRIEALRPGQDLDWQWGDTNDPVDTGFSSNRLETERPGSSLHEQMQRRIRRPGFRQTATINAFATYNINYQTRWSYKFERPSIMY
jgi:hypothetical protein